MRQLKMKYYLMKQEKNRQDQQKKVVFQKLQEQKKFESNKKMNTELNKLEEMVYKKTQEKQQLIDSIPRIVREEMRKALP